MGQPDSGQRIRCGLQMAGGAASVQSDFAGAGKIQTIMMLGLVFVETVVIYALIIAVLVIFVL